MSRLTAAEKFKRLSRRIRFISLKFYYYECDPAKKFCRSEERKEKAQLIEDKIEDLKGALKEYYGPEIAGDIYWEVSER
ncbi:MAG: hypothetical protein AB7H97_06390 [Pseudobdellovibrionaceae bacterium]